MENDYPMYPWEGMYIENTGMCSILFPLNGASKIIHYEALMPSGRMWWMFCGAVCTPALHDTGTDFLCITVDQANKIKYTSSIISL